MGLGLKGNGVFLIIDWIAIDGKLHLIEGGTISDEIVLKIEGVAIQRIMEYVE